MKRSAPEEAATEYRRLFPSVYLWLHRRDRKRSALSGAAQALLTHLAGRGPLSIGECARHFERAQSVVSETVDQLERRDLLARVADDGDRRRRLVWLTDAGRARLLDDQDVLSGDLLRDAIQRMSSRHRSMLIEETRALVEAASTTRTSHEERS
jgi:DNA-binding MarR family transcriptional regulator